MARGVQEGDVARCIIRSIFCGWHIYCVGANGLSNAARLARRHTSLPYEVKQ